MLRIVLKIVRGTLSQVENRCSKSGISMKWVTALIRTYVILIIERY